MKKIFGFILTAFITLLVFSTNVFAEAYWDEYPTVELDTQNNGTFTSDNFANGFYSAIHDYKIYTPGPGKIHVTLSHDSKYSGGSANSVILQVSDLRKYLFRDDYQGNTVTTPEIDVQQGIYLIHVVAGLNGVTQFDQPINYNFTVYFTPDSNSPVQNTDGSIYRLYNENTGEHLYTPDFNEATVLASNGWTNENIGWTAPLRGEAVFRLYNPGNGDHLYTTDINEVGVLTTEQGWQADNNAQPLFYSGGEVPIYRLYQPETGRHHLTKDSNEYNVLPAQGWEQEGQKLSCLS